MDELPGALFCRCRGVPEVPQQALELFLVSVVILPPTEVRDVVVGHVGQPVFPLLTRKERGRALLEAYILDGVIDGDREQVLLNTIQLSK